MGKLGSRKSLAWTKSKQSIKLKLAKLGQAEFESYLSLGQPGIQLFSSPVSVKLTALKENFNALSENVYMSVVKLKSL